MSKTEQDKRIEIFNMLLNADHLELDHEKAEVEVSDSDDSVVIKTTEKSVKLHPDNINAITSSGNKVVSSDSDDVVHCFSLVPDIPGSRVVHPHHYNKGTVEVIDVKCLLSSSLGDVYKYVLRHRFKLNPIEDLNKALYYLEDVHDSLPSGPPYRTFIPWLSMLSLRERRAAYFRSISPTVCTADRALAMITNVRRHDVDDYDHSMDDFLVALCDLLRSVLDPKRYSNPAPYVQTMRAAIYRMIVDIQNT